MRRPNDHPPSFGRRLAAGLTLVTIVYAAGCSSTATRPEATRPTATGPTATGPTATEAAASTPASPTPGAKAPTRQPAQSPSTAPSGGPSLGGTPSAAGGDAFDILVLRQRDGSGYALMVGRSAELMFTLPSGVPTRDWKVLYTTDPPSGSSAVTTVRAVTPEGGGTTLKIDIPGTWELPTIGLAATVSGLSADGRTLVLVEPAEARSRADRTLFAVVRTDGSAKPAIISLKGAFTFDALSSDGSSAYVIESTGDALNYQVRRLDLGSGKLVGGAIVDKREADEAMAGAPITQLAGGNGWVYTLYRGPNGAFVHALDTAGAIAVCVDLPGTNDATLEAMRSWGLAESGPALYVTDGTPGGVRAIDLGDFSVEAAHAGAAAVLAKFESGEWTAGGKAVVSRDGDTLYAATSGGIAVTRTSDLAPAGRLGSGGFVSVAAAASGTVYGVDGLGGVSRLESGRQPPVQLAPSGYDSIAAVVTLR